MSAIVGPSLYVYRPSPLSWCSYDTSVQPMSANMCQANCGRASNVNLHRQGCAGLARGALVRSILALGPPACEGEFGVPAGGKGAVPGIGVRVPDVLRLANPVRHNGIPPR